jgi:hypothetical protein
METKNVKFAEFTNSNLELNNSSLYGDVRNFAPVMSSSRDVYILFLIPEIVVYIPPM